MLVTRLRYGNDHEGHVIAEHVHAEALNPDSWQHQRRRQQRCVMETVRLP